ncbi:unnamed protein product, partial [Adineta steineri]
IITGSRDTPVIIPDTNIEDSFDLQGCFVGKLPFDTDGLSQMMSRRPPPPPTFEPQQQHRSQLPLIPRRPPSESALRSM